MTQKTTDFGLLKIPESVLLKDALIEIGKLKSYTHELEDEVREYRRMKKGEMKEIRLNSRIMEQKETIDELKKRIAELITWKIMKQKDES